MHYTAKKARQWKSLLPVTSAFAFFLFFKYSSTVSLHVQSHQPAPCSDKMVSAVTSRLMPKLGTSTTPTSARLRGGKCPLSWGPTGSSLRGGERQLTTSSCASSPWKLSSAGSPTPSSGKGITRRLYTHNTDPSCPPFPLRRSAR